MRYPRCEKLGVLRSITLGTNPGAKIVSTAALYQALKRKDYYDCCEVYTYKYNGGPSPESIERFLTERKLP